MCNVYFWILYQTNGNLNNAENLNENKKKTIQMGNRHINIEIDQFKV